MISPARRSPAEPPVQRWINRAAVDDDPPVAHLMNLLSGSFLVYAFVTRGSLAVSRVIGAVYARIK